MELHQFKPAENWVLTGSFPDADKVSLSHSQMMSKGTMESSPGHCFNSHSHLWELVRGLSTWQEPVTEFWFLNLYLKFSTGVRHYWTFICMIISPLFMLLLSRREVGRIALSLILSLAHCAAVSFFKHRLKTCYIWAILISYFTSSLPSPCTQDENINLCFGLPRYDTMSM